MPEKVLAEDWSAYDNIKNMYGNATNFACTEEWEVMHLVKTIQLAYPELLSSNIKIAIATTCKTLGSPYPRAGFVAHVMKKL